MEKALKEFTALDSGHYLPDPCTARPLGDQGAEVIKIEPDPLRKEKEEKSENPRDRDQDPIKKGVQYVLADYSNAWK